MVKKEMLLVMRLFYMEGDDGRLAPIRRIEVQESTIIGQPSIRLVIKAEKRRAIISPTFNQT